MKKRILRTVTICLALLLCFVPLRTGLAAGPQTATSVCFIGTDYFDSINEAVTFASDGDTIHLIKDTVLGSVVVITKNITIVGETSGLVISRASSIEMFALNGSSASLTLQNVIIDGGAVWSNTTPSAAAAQTRTNSALTVDRQTMISGLNGSTLNLEAGSVLRNADSLLTTSPSVAFGAAVNLWSSNINMRGGAVIENMTGSTNNVGGNYAAGVCMNNGGTFNMYDGVIRGCYAKDTNSNCGAAVFIRSDSTAVSGTFNMYDGARIEGNINNTYGAVTIRASNLNMYGNSLIEHNQGYYAGGVLAYTYSTMQMHDSSSVSYNQSTNTAGGVYISSNTGDATSYSSLTMSDQSKISHNMAAGNAGGCFIVAGTITMAGDSEISSNSALRGGGLYMPTFTGTGREVANLLGGKIVNNSVSDVGAAIFHGGTALNLNAADFEIDNEIFLWGDGTNANAKVVSLIGAPSANSFLLDTSTGDTFAGRDVVRPASITLGGTNYQTTDAAGYESSFTHTSMYVVKGADHYGAADTSHDTYLVLHTQPPVPTPTPNVTPTPVPSADIPVTGDTRSIMPLVVAMLSSLGLLFAASYVWNRKRR